MRTATTTAKDIEKKGKENSNQKKKKDLLRQMAWRIERAAGQRRGRGEEKHIIVLFDESKRYLHRKGQ
jgi:hypothetical protein